MSAEAQDRPDCDRYAAAMAARYDEIRRDARRHLAAHAPELDGVTVPGGDRWGVSAVLRPPLPQAAWEALAELRDIIGDDHLFYGPSDVHLTLRSLERYRPEADANEAVIGAYAEALRWAFMQSPPFVVAFRGIISGRSGLLLCGYAGEALHALRRQLFARLASEGLAHSGPETIAEKLRTTAHVSLAVYRKPLASAPRLLKQLDRLSTERFGSFQPTEAEIVRYRLASGRIQTETLASIAIDFASAAVPMPLEHPRCP